MSGEETVAVRMAGLRAVGTVLRRIGNQMDEDTSTTTLSWLFGKLGSEGAGGKGLEVALTMAAATTLVHKVSPAGLGHVLGVCHGLVVLPSHCFVPVTSAGR